MDNIFFIFDAIDFIARLMIVVIFFLIASTMKKIDPDVIRSRLFLEYDQIIKAFNMMFVGSIFFFIAAVIEYFINPCNTIYIILTLTIPDQCTLSAGNGYGLAGIVLEDIL